MINDLLNEEIKKLSLIFETSHKISRLETVKKKQFTFLACHLEIGSSQNQQRYVLMVIDEINLKVIFKDSNIIDKGIFKTSADCENMVKNYFNHVSKKLNDL